MTDHFAILRQPRRPWLEPSALKEEFHRRSGSVHPDVPGTGDAGEFAALNAAHAALSDPANRVRHLLALIAPAVLASAAAPPGELGDLFMQIASLRHRLDRLLAQRAAATTPLARALLAGDESAMRKEFAALLAGLESANATALDELRELDSTWSNADAATIDSLAHLSHRLAYLGRWLAQTREAVFALGA